jgi:hypothetical protein
MSDFIPLIHGDAYHNLVDYVESRVGTLVKQGASSRKLKMTNAIIGLIKRSLTGDELKKFNEVIKNAKLLTEKKRFYVSNYGIKNYIDIVNGKTNELVKDENYDKFELNNIIEWWKKKASNRFNNLKTENKLRTELEIWSPDAVIDIIR